MRKVFTLILSVLLFPLTCMAGEIYGTIGMNNRPLPGVRIEVTEPSGRNIIDQAVTDRFGRYRLYVRKTGPCKLRAYINGGSNYLNIISYQSSVRYNLIIIKERGTYNLQRR